MRTIRGLSALVIVAGFLATGCPSSDWKIQGGADACRAMCKKWGLQFTAMVGVGDQEKSYGQGATACVCQPRELVRKPSGKEGAASASASLAGPITEAAAAAAAAAQQQTLRNQQVSAPGR